MSALDKRDKNLANIMKSRDEGFLTPAEAARAAGKVDREFQEQSKKDDPKALAGKALQKGSSESLSALNKMRADALGAKRDIVADNTRQMLAEEKRGNTILDEISKKLGNPPQPKVANF